MNTVMSCLLLSFLCLVLVHCGDETSGSAPVIGGLEILSTPLAAGRSATIELRFTFSDADADVSSYVLELDYPDSVTLTIGPRSLDMPESSRGGDTLQLVIGGLPSSDAGTIDLELWLEDDGNNESNHVSGQILVE